MGGMGGVLLGWGLAQVANVFIMAYLAGQSVQTGAPPSVAAATPAWLPAFALVFAALMGLRPLSGAGRGHALTNHRTEVRIGVWCK